MQCIYGTIKSHLWRQSTNHRFWVWFLHCMCVFMCVIKGSLYSLCVSLCIKVTSTAAVWTDVLTLFQSSIFPYIVPSILSCRFFSFNLYLYVITVSTTHNALLFHLSQRWLSGLCSCLLPSLKHTNTQTQMPTHHRWEPVFVNLSDKDAVWWVTRQYFLPY